MSRLIYSMDSDSPDLREILRVVRRAMEEQGLGVAGTPSPIVPVSVGEEKVARLASKYLEANGLLANLVEFPAVPKGKARFRFQVMSSHEEPMITQAATIMAAAKIQAMQFWGLW
ncbi:MAG: hypothetical protein L0Z62_41890 [Gemmataceae bacterium]|nr:hypothetical protein [Gemmataceae bacterium]